jgi:hypothetical protein
MHGEKACSTKPSHQGDLTMTKKGYKQTPEHIQKRITKASVEKRIATRYFQRPEYKEKMRQALSGSNNPRFGVKLSDELKKRISNSEKGKVVVVTDETRAKMSKALKGKYVGEKHWQWKGGRKNSRVHSPLLYAIRFCGKYEQWKQAVLKIHTPTYPEVPKGLQVHHLKKLTTILKENNIQTFEEALNCPEIWDVNNGVVMTKGEHYIISMIQRHKKFSRDFVQLLSDWIDAHGNDVVDLKHALLTDAIKPLSYEENSTLLKVMREKARIQAILKERKVTVE